MEHGIQSAHSAPPDLPPKKLVRQLDFTSAHCGVPAVAEGTILHDQKLQPLQKQMPAPSLSIPRPSSFAYDLGTVLLKLSLCILIESFLLLSSYTEYWRERIINYRAIVSPSLVAVRIPNGMSHLLEGEITYGIKRDPVFICPSIYVHSSIISDKIVHEEKHFDLEEHAESSLALSSNYNVETQIRADLRKISVDDRLSGTHADKITGESCYDFADRQPMSPGTLALMCDEQDMLCMTSHVNNPPSTLPINQCMPGFYAEQEKCVLVAFRDSLLKLINCGTAKAYSFGQRPSTSKHSYKLTANELSFRQRSLLSPAKSPLASEFFVDSCPSLSRENCSKHRLWTPLLSQYLLLTDPCLSRETIPYRYLIVPMAPRVSEPGESSRQNPVPSATMGDAAMPQVPPVPAAPEGTDIASQIAKAVTVALMEFQRGLAAGFPAPVQVPVPAPAPAAAPVEMTLERYLRNFRELQPSNYSGDETPMDTDD
ncbi:Protein tesmin/TSO1-like CXC 5 [Platanthera zijinensis]|uniref:Protein tesmin/TSO1-like CXC 5 n=1 Tax=Platanthera zijinensis TaxID=2320716 RepID=A0AAP0BA98_9ASPA